MCALAWILPELIAQQVLKDREILEGLLWGVATSAERVRSCDHRLERVDV